MAEQERDELGRFAGDGGGNPAAKVLAAAKTGATEKVKLPTLPNQERTYDHRQTINTAMMDSLRAKGLTRDTKDAGSRTDIEDRHARAARSHASAAQSWRDAQKDRGTSAEDKAHHEAHAKHHEAWSKHHTREATEIASKRRNERDAGDRAWARGR